MAGKDRPDRPRVPEAVRAILAFLKREFPDAPVKHWEHFDSGDWVFELQIGTERYPRRLVVTEERLADREPGRTAAQEVTAALERQHIADALRRQPKDKELVFAYLGVTTQERRARR